jgi:hypothetical protein
MNPRPVGDEVLHSTVGREAAFLIESALADRYPPTLSSLI